MILYLESDRELNRPGFHLLDQAVILFGGELRRVNTVLRIKINEHEVGDIAHRLMTEGFLEYLQNDKSPKWMPPHQRQKPMTDWSRHDLLLVFFLTALVQADRRLAESFECGQSRWFAEGDASQYVITVSFQRSTEVQLTGSRDGMRSG